MTPRPNDEEIERLQQFWKAERERLSFTFRYSDEEAWNLVWSTPEGKEWDRLVNLQEGHLARMGELVEKMWSMPARTEAGRKAKVLVLLGCVIRQNFNLPDEASDYDALITRQLLFELVGSEAGAARAVRLSLAYDVLGSGAAPIVRNVAASVAGVPMR